jgi:hypothetical protein
MEKAAETYQKIFGKSISEAKYLKRECIFHKKKQ